MSASRTMVERAGSPRVKIAATGERRAVYTPHTPHRRAAPNVAHVRSHLSAFAIARSLLRSD